MISRQPGQAAAYWQLAQLLRDRIRDGVYPAGATLPGEKTLSQEHEVSRETVRKAIGELRKEGLVVTRRPGGTVVRDDREREEFSLQRGSRITFRMPTPAERAEHDLDEGVPVAVVRHGARTRVFPGDRWSFIVK